MAQGKTDRRCGRCSELVIFGKRFRCDTCNKLTCWRCSRHWTTGLHTNRHYHSRCKDCQERADELILNELKEKRARGEIK